MPRCILVPLRVLPQHRWDHKDAVLKAHANAERSGVGGGGVAGPPSRCATPGQRLIITPSEVRRRRFDHSSKIKQVGKCRTGISFALRQLIRRRG